MNIFSLSLLLYLPGCSYFKATKKYQKYLEHSAFLPDINNEREEKNAEYKRRFSALNRLVLIKYTKDTVLKPLETEWFQFYGEGEEVCMNDCFNLYVPS